MPDADVVDGDNVGVDHPCQGLALAKEPFSRLDLTRFPQEFEGNRSIKIRIERAKNGSAAALAEQFEDHVAIHLVAASQIQALTLVPARAKAVLVTGRDRTTSNRPVNPRVPQPGGVPTIGHPRGGPSVRIEGRSVVVGSATTCGLRLEGRGLSRRHAKFVRGMDNRVTVVDLDSTNGTFVDGTRVQRAPVDEASFVLLGPEVAVRLRYEIEASGTIAPGAALTGREREVFDLLVAGHENQGIADSLGIARRTVTTHVTRIFGKLGIDNRLQLIRRYQRR